MAPAVPLAVLDRLVSQLVGGHPGVPVADRLAQTAPPPAHPVHILGEVEQVRPDPGHSRQSRQRRPPCIFVSERRAHSEGKQSRVVLRRPSGFGHGDDLPHDAGSVRRDAPLDRLSVVQRQRLLGSIERAAFAS